MREMKNGIIRLYKTTVGSANGKNHWTNVKPKTRTSFKLKSRIARKPLHNAESNDSFSDKYSQKRAKFHVNRGVTRMKLLGFFALQNDWLLLLCPNRPISNILPLFCRGASLDSILVSSVMNGGQKRFECD